MRSNVYRRSLLFLAPCIPALMTGCTLDTGSGAAGGRFVLSTNPADGAAGIASGTNVTITFSGPAVPDSLAGSFNPDISGFNVDWSPDNSTVTVTPLSVLADGTRYTVTIEGISLADGARLSTPFSFSFTTAGSTSGDGGIAGPRRAGVWEQAGFGGAGNFIGVYYDPSQSGVVYACSDVAGVYRSTDGGHTWEIRSAGLGNYQIASFAVDPFDSDTLYAGAGAFAESNKAGLYVSHDAGLSWQHLQSTAANGISFRRFRTNDAIAPHPARRGVIITGSRRNGIWRSEDAGETWSQVYLPDPTRASIPSIEGTFLVPDDSPAPFIPPVSAVVFDPDNSDVVYAGLLGGGVVKSTDGGVSWNTVNTGLPESAVIEGVGVGRGDVVYAAAGFDGMYKSIDGGASWRAVNGDIPLVDEDGGGWRTFVAVDPTDSNIAYMAMAAGGAGVAKTTDGGLTWTINDNPDEVTYDSENDPTRVWSAGFAETWQVRIDPLDRNHLLSVSFWTIQRSDDAGQTWADSPAGAQNTCVNALYLDTDGETAILYAANWDAGLLRSMDGGQSWSAVVPRGPEDRDAFAGHVWRMDAARVGDVKYYYATADPWTPVDTGQVLRSTDGLNWTSVFQTPRREGGFLSGMLGLAIDPTDPATVYVSQDGGSVFKTTDNGDTWAATVGQPADNSFTYALAVDDVGRVFAGTLNDGLFRSTDGGATWEKVLVNRDTVMFCVTTPRAVYAAAGDANLHRSTDGGDTWQTLTSFRSVDDGDGVGDTGWAVAVDPGDPDHILFSRQEAWHTSDDGAGIVESFDGGSTWGELNKGLGLPNVSSIVFGSNGTLYAGTSCGGVWRLRPE